MTEHEHPHSHAPPQPDHPQPESWHQYLGLALNELLMEKGVYSAEELHQMIDAIENIDASTHGARVVAKAWVDPDFRKTLLTEPTAAIAALGLDPGSSELRILECTESLHHVVVCTLCSCYPRALLGPPPTWYKSASYRGRLVCDPRGVLKEFGTEIESETEIRVHDSTAELRFLVLPKRPENTNTLSEQQLQNLVTRDSMIGVTRLCP